MAGRLAVVLYSCVLASAASGAEGDATGPAIPFRHRVGDRWRLVVERSWEGPDRAATADEVEAEVVSPLPDGWLVRLAWVRVVREGVSYALTPRTAEAASMHDAAGGGDLRVRVDRGGAARQVLNWEEARAALERARAAGVPAPDPARREIAEGLLLADWNFAYGVCDARLAPGGETADEVEVPDASGGPPHRARRVRRLARDHPGRAGIREVTTLLSFEEVPLPGGLRGRLEESSVHRFDPATGRLSGSIRRALRAATGSGSVTIAFREEEAAPAFGGEVVARR